MQDEVVVAAMVGRACSLGHAGDPAILRRVSGDLLSIADPAGGMDQVGRRGTSHARTYPFASHLVHARSLARNATPPSHSAARP